MPKRRPICDVPGCGRSRYRWQRLCARCYKALPGDIRTGLIEAKKLGRRAAWRHECRRAAEHLAPLLAGDAPRPRSRISPAEAYERNRRLLGEQP